MPGPKAIADTLEGNAQSRAVSMHAAGVGLAGAGSFAISGMIDAMFGPTAAFLFGGVAALGALTIAWLAMPRTRQMQPNRAAARGLLDFRPVFRNRRAMAWIPDRPFTPGNSALRAWGVTFLTVTGERLRDAILASRAHAVVHGRRPCRDRRFDIRQ